jgi:uncharacterized protein
MSRNITFPAGDLLLEGDLHSPTAGQNHAAAITPCPAAVVCHAHPLYGGDMQNSVVVAICDALAVDGMAALRFNFRGVGASDGSYGGGKDERRDVRAAIDFLASQPEMDPRRLCLAGYSFGALVALSAGDERVRALAAISPPLSPPSFASPRLRCPALFVFGERDTISPADGLETSGIELPEGSRVAVIRGADHFWRGEEKAVAAAVVEFFRHHTAPA